MRGDEGDLDPHGRRLNAAGMVNGRVYRNPLAPVMQAMSEAMGGSAESLTEWSRRNLGEAT